MKNTIYYIAVFLLTSIVSGQELFLQDSDQLKGSVKVMGKEYVTVYDNTNHRYRYFNDSGKEIFLIKSFNELGEEINLSIEKNSTTESIEIIVDNKPIGFVVNSIVYNLDMIEIGRLFEGRYSQKNVNDFWEGANYSKGNISIYDYTGVYKIGSFYFKPEVDYYAILGINKITNIDEMDTRSLKKEIRNTQRLYKKLMRTYDLKRNPDNTEIADKVAEINKAYEVVMGDLGFSDKRDKKILGIIPEDYFDEEKRSNWSGDEGYVPYSKRPIQEHTPDSKIQTDELYYSNE